MHVLSTPPAFILSQDQTLNKMVLKRAKARSNQVIDCDLRYQELTWFTFVSECIQVLRKILSGAFVCCFTLFNLQGTRFCALLSVEQLSYCIITSVLCQALFSNLFKFFSSISTCFLLAFSKAACLCYHRQLSLSSTFFFTVDATFRARFVFRSALTSELVNITTSACNCQY